MLSRQLFIQRFNLFPDCSDYIITAQRAGWALVSGLFFRHPLVVEPSACLLHQAAWLLIAFGFSGQGFQQFTQFYED